MFHALTNAKIKIGAGISKSCDFSNSYCRVSSDSKIMYIKLELFTFRSKELYATTIQQMFRNLSF